ncbi:ABC transporter ATP-binding protein [Mycetocola tolaasinivorans]|uniref:ABC transporter ATP-binding protein n=1 Tax=Mycetocola tolaasinivorans TaxID=76635 RepID=A0A3L6ZVK8_9MICO|nr:ABC transporter ATP-binding protein [Mycetocola tolaasinivorans]RLP71899.1 ABC transporter ATP-binding protein [Mycetocola tolaasinivorans]
MRRIGFRGARAQFGIGIVSLILSSVATAVQPLLVRRLAESFLAQNPLPTLIVLLLITSFLTDAIGAALSKLLLGFASERFVFNLRNSVVGTMLRTDHRRFSSFDRGDLNNRVVEDIPAAQQPYFSTYPELLSSIIVSVLCFIGLLFASLRLSLALVAVLMLVGLAMMLVLRAVRIAAERSREAEAAYSSRLYEMLYNFVPIKSLRAETWMLGMLSRQAEESRRRGARLITRTSLILPIINTGTQVSIVGVLILGGVEIARGNLEPAQLATFFLFLVYMISPLVTIAVSLGELGEAEASRARLKVVFDGLPGEPGTAEVKLPASPPSLSCTSQDLTYQYENGERVRIPDIEFRGPGAYCLTGGNGAGKSTLFHLMNGLYTPTTGTLSWNGLSVDEGSSAEIRRLVYLMPQSRDVLSMSVRDNLLMGAILSDKEILTLAARVGVLDFFTTLPDGLDTKIGNDGIDLSGGQKQLIFVFHALLTKPRVLLLDEFASNLDAPLKSAISNVLAELATDGLVIVITHDRELLERFPQHIVLGRSASAR